MTRMATLIVVIFYLLHQDFWFWREARPLVFGVLPIGFFYHAAYMVAASLILWGLVTYLWPSQLEAPAEPLGGVHDGRHLGVRRAALDRSASIEREGGAGLWGPREPSATRGAGDPATKNDALGALRPAQGVPSLSRGGVQGSPPFNQ